MNIIKKSFRYGLKLSKNYQSIDICEGFEVEMKENNVKEIEYFEATANDLKLRVMEQAKLAIEGLEKGEVPTPTEPKKDETISKLQGME